MCVATAPGVFAHNENRQSTVIDPAGDAEFDSADLERDIYSNDGLRDAAAHRLLGYAYLKRQQFGPATKEFERALEINPNDADSHDALGSVWLYTGQADAAIESIETAFRFNPELPSSGLIHLGLAYYLKGQYREAITTLERELGRSPNLVILHVALSAAYAQAGRDEDAAQAAADVRRLHPFFEVDMFGNGFRDPTDRDRIREGLLRAGLK